MQNKFLASSTLLLAVASAQTSSLCDPTKTQCPADPGMGSAGINLASMSKNPAGFTTQSGAIDSANGAASLTITKQGDAPTFISSGYFFFGTAEVHMKTSAGTGIISSIVLLSDDLDEVDWEFLGGNATQVQTNYFGKGKSVTPPNVDYVTIADAQADYHNYTLDWSKDRIVWYVDGGAVRTLTYDQAGPAQYPQTPMQLKIGTWAGGDPSNAAGTIAWAGGPTRYSQGPFVASVKSVVVTDASQGQSYQYSGTDGSWQKVTVDRSNGAAGTGSAPGGSGSAGSGNGTSPASPAGSAGAPGAANAATVSAVAPSGIPTGLIGSSTGGNGSAPANLSGAANATGSVLGSANATTSSGSPPASSATTASGVAAVVGRSGLVAAAAAVVALGMALL